MMTCVHSLKSYVTSPVYCVGLSEPRTACFSSMVRTNPQVFLHAKVQVSFILDPSIRNLTHTWPHLHRLLHGKHGLKIHGRHQHRSFRAMAGLSLLDLQRCYPVPVYHPPSWHAEHNMQALNRNRKYVMIHSVTFWRIRPGGGGRSY